MKPSIIIAFDDLEIICSLALQAINISTASKHIKKQIDVAKWQAEIDYAVQVTSESIRPYSIGDNPKVHRVISTDALGLIETLGG